ncbi:MAG: putative phosphothreonine lyase domain-containing protein, partial [Patescibacteria group bacterium]
MDEIAVRHYLPPILRMIRKWLVFVNDHSLPGVWNKIKTALEEGKLGDLAKTSAKRSGSERKVICVYTYDWTDREDVKRVREELRRIGITRKIPYKADEDTERGVYRTNSREKVSKYYE